MLGSLVGSVEFADKLARSTHASLSVFLQLRQTPPCDLEALYKLQKRRFAVPLAVRQFLLFVLPFFPESMV